MHLGVSLRPSYTNWPDLREFGIVIDELGFDSLWTSDHFVVSPEDPHGAVFEGWQLLAAWGALTSRVRIGLLVSGNTYRHPAVVANMAATLDHITDGRAILGLGAAWFEFEHRAYGIQFNDRAVRLDRLAEAATVVRSLLDQPRTTFRGRHYQLRDAPCEPKPIQPHLPLMIGGGGERRTLRIAAQHADMWNGFGNPAEMAHKLQVLRAHCAAVGRDPAEILSTVAFVTIIRDDSAALQAKLDEINRVNVGDKLELGPSGTVEDVAHQMAAYWRVGVRGFIIDMAAPYDRETLERLAREVRPILAELTAES